MRLDKVLKFPQFISDGMVLQREQEIKIWGEIKIDAGTTKSLTINISFAGGTYTAIGDAQGKWQIIIPSLKAGGPYEMVITAGDEQVVIKDILIGDVWLCGGQSNMELPISRVMERYKEEVNSYENPAIRMFHVPMKYEFNTPQNTLDSGRWQVLNQDNVQDFIATGYFFAKALYEKYGVPIGLIHTAIGGTPVQAWMSEEALREFPIYLEQMAKYKDDICVEKVLKEDGERINSWYSKLNALDLSQLEIDDNAGWKQCEMPSYLRDEDLGEGGSVWFKKEIDVPEVMVGKEGRLLLGTIVDNDIAYINGIQVGATSYRYPPRIYTVPADTLKEGKNVILIRVCFERKEVGFTPDKSCCLEIGGEVISLEGQWQYKIGAKMNALKPQIFLQYEPTGLYNGMIYPLKDMRLKGVIWYQGESNTHQPQDYKPLFEGLIKDWRRTFQHENLPFIYVQLPNFETSSEAYYGPVLRDTENEIAEEKLAGGWAAIRQAQLETLEMPYTAMVVAIDGGEWNDLHPLNKKLIGERLVRVARGIAYGEEITYCSPVAEGVIRKEDKLIVSFNHIGSGLMMKGDTLKQFMISEDGKHFYKAKARLENNEVIVWHEKIKVPIEVRYAWLDNPEGANLYNKEGLPISPFGIKLYR